MTGDKISIDEAALQRNVAAFLRTPAAERVYEELDTPWWLCLIVWVFVLVAGLIMLPTIIWTITGLKMIWSALRFQQFSVLADNTRRRPDLIKPLIGCGIIIGPDEKHALALGTFRSPREYSADRLAMKASELATLYSDGSDRPEDKSVCELLHDDTYHPYRRRRVPEPHAEGLEMFLLDVEVELPEGRMTPYDTVLFAFLATGGDKGEIVQIPWAVVQDAVHIAAND